MQDRLNSELDAAMQRIADAAVETVKRNFNSYAANATGKTRDSIQAIRTDNKGLQIVATGDRAQIIQYIENGRRPGKQPPLEAILTWMNEVGLTTGNERNDHNTAFMLARSIGRYGSQGHHIFERSTDEIDRNANKEIADAVKRALG
jgi:hypothetical protein